MSKDYLPNNWQHWHDAPEDLIGEIPYDEFMEWKIGGWQLPSSHTCIIRATNKDTGKITERAYKKQAAAEERIRQLILENNYELTVVDHETVQHYIRKSDETN